MLVSDLPMTPPESYFRDDEEDDENLEDFGDDFDDDDYDYEQDLANVESLERSHQRFLDRLYNTKGL